MNNLGDVFEKKLAQLRIKKQINAALICEAFDKAVAEVFGEQGAKNVKAISYKNNTLKVGVSSSVWASEINLRQLELAEDRSMRFIYKQDLHYLR